MPADPADLLRQRGYRVTGQRLAVLRAVSRAPHVTADAVAETVRAEMGAISLQAVYDVLGVLADVGLVRRIQPAGSPARFEARVSDNHHHVICRVCGRTADVDCAVGSAPCLTAVDDRGTRSTRPRSSTGAAARSASPRPRGEPRRWTSECRCHSQRDTVRRRAASTPVPGNRTAARGGQHDRGEQVSGRALD